METTTFGLWSLRMCCWDEAREFVCDMVDDARRGLLVRRQHKIYFNNDEWWKERDEASARSPLFA